LIFDVERLRAEPLLSCARDVHLACNVKTYWLLESSKFDVFTSSKSFEPSHYNCVEKSIRRTLHLHPSVEAFCDGQVEFFCDASTEAWRARSDAPGGTVTCSSLEIGRCTTLRLISLRVGNDDFATTKKTRV
jgi:hypothetical protein